jgi:hypothetical protein
MKTKKVGIQLENLIRKLHSESVIKLRMKRKKRDMFLLNIKEIISLTKKIMNNLAGPKVLTNLNGQEKMKILIIKTMVLCGVLKLKLTKMKIKKKNLILNIFGVRHQREVELDLSTKMSKEQETNQMREKLSKGKRKV